MTMFREPVRDLAFIVSLQGGDACLTTGTHVPANAPIKPGTIMTEPDDDILSYSKRQRRQEKVGYFLTNGNVAYADGKVETVSCKCEDPTVDTTTEPWLPGQNVEAGAERRVGFYVWACNRSHVTAANFSADQEASDGTDLWRLVGTTQAPSGGANIATYFTTPRGVATVVAVAYKGLKKIALSQRSVSVTFTVLLEDWPDVSTACAATVTAPDSLLPGGVATGKVTNVEISRSGLNDYPRATVTITCCDGSGVPGTRSTEGPNPSGQPWDGVFLASPIGQPYPPMAVPGAAVSVEFHPQAQVAFIQANDFTGQPGRNDRTENDPKRLLTKCHTKVTFACAPIAGQPALRNDIALGAGAWLGPAQISFPTV